MPVYFAHGFRWPRAGFTGIRVHTIFHNLEDCSAEYIQNTRSQAAILASFRRAWPDVMRELDDEAHGGRGKGLTLLEEYDPEDLWSENAVSRPWAFVCDFVRVMPTGTGRVQEEEVVVVVGDEGGPGGGAGKGREVRGPGGPEGTKSVVGSVVKGPALSMNITELIAQGPGSTPKAWEALADLRDKIAAGEKIDWWVIYNGDPERAYDDDDSGFDEEEEEDAEDVVAEEQGEEVYADQQQNRKTFVPQVEAIHRHPEVSPVSQAPAPVPAPPPVMEKPTTDPGRTVVSPPPPIPPLKDREKGKRMPGMRAFPPLEQPMSPPPAPAPVVRPVAKPVVKPETSLKKKFFGKK